MSPIIKPMNKIMASARLIKARGKRVTDQRRTRRKRLKASRPSSETDQVLSAPPPPLLPLELDELLLELLEEDDEELLLELEELLLDELEELLLEDDELLELEELLLLELELLEDEELLVPAM
jgi:hypothetical protein